jgi:isopenicillin-N epimerase
VIRERLSQFPISPDLLMLNHASFGLMTHAVMQLAERTRADLEADSLALIDPDALVLQMQRAASSAEHQLGLSAGSVALTQNATSGAAALMRSIRLRPGETVVVLSTEYDSIVRGWQVRCEESGSNFLRFEVPIPLLSTPQLIEALEEQVRGDVRIAQLSLVTSSTAVTFPVKELASWFRERGALVFLDIAHGPGHVTLEPEVWGVSAMFGTLHKWFPTPRPVGILWADHLVRPTLRPGEVSLTWDSSDLVERFSWPGTHDPTPSLCVKAAIEEWNAWEIAGDLDRCEELAEYTSVCLSAIGTPTSAREFLPPRLRAVVIPGHAKATVRAALDAAMIRGWVGTGPNGETMLRVATHVYNEEADVDRLCEVVAGLK